MYLLAKLFDNWITEFSMRRVAKSKLNKLLFSEHDESPKSVNSSIMNTLNSQLLSQQIHFLALRSWPKTLDITRSSQVCIFYIKNEINNKNHFRHFFKTKFALVQSTFYLNQNWLISINSMYILLFLIELKKRLVVNKKKAVWSRENYSIVSLHSSFTQFQLQVQ